MRLLRWFDHPRTLATLTLLFALVPVALAISMFRDGRQKDEKLYETSVQMLGEQLHSATMRNLYFLGVMQDQARGMPDEALAQGKMQPVYDWKEKLPHLLAFAYAEQQTSGPVIVRWKSGERRPVVSVGDDLARDQAVVDALKAASSTDRVATASCVMGGRRLLVLLPVLDTATAHRLRGYVTGWLDLESLCHDPSMALLKDEVLKATPVTKTEPVPPSARRVTIRDVHVEWSAAVVRGPGFGLEYGPPTQWLALIGVGLSALPLVVLMVLAGRATKLRAALASERELSRTQSCFFNSVSHEFRTPLSVILSGADLLESYAGQLSAEERSHLLAQIKSNTRQMNDMVEHVLMLGRMDSKKFQPNPKLIPVGALCDEVACEVRAANQDRCPIVVKAPEEEAWLDAALMRTILGNLLSNAVKYSAPGSEVKLEVRVTDDSIAFTISDAGIGIPPEDLPQVCEPFHRSGNVGSVPGTGLGLAIVQRCTKLLGGTFEIQSMPGQGTTVTVTLRREPV